MLKGAYGINEEDFQRLVAITESQKQSDSGYLQKFFGGFFAERKILAEARSILKSNNMAPDNINKVLRLIKKELTLNNRIENLQLMHKLFRYWHVAHLPFALIMLIIVIIHVIVTITFGAHWIFE
jgi:hypothetical protein